MGLKKWLKKRKRVRNKKRAARKQEIYKGQRFAEKVLLFIAVWLTIFTVVVLVGFFVTGGVEPTQLIESVFTVVGIELGGLLVKRIFDKRVPVDEDSEDSEDEEEEVEEEYD